MAKQIKDLIDSLIPAEHHWKFVLFKHWNEIIGSLKNKVAIEKIDNDILFLTVSHPVWAHELLLLTPLLKKKINQFFDQPRIKIIRFHNLTTPKQVLLPQATTSRNHLHLQKSLPLEALTHEEKTLLARISDKTLQSVIIDYLIRCKTLKRSQGHEKSGNQT